MAPYPSPQAISEAGVTDLLGWNRFLPSPVTEAERAILDMIIKNLTQKRDEDPGAYIRASKNLGW